MIDRLDVDPTAIEALAYGVVVPEPERPNLAREIVPYDQINPADQIDPA